MTPIEQAMAVYERENCVRSFREDLWLHLAHGFVFSSPDCFVMGRAVCSWWPTEWIVNPAFDPQCGDVPDCWHVALFAGRLGAWIERLFPHELELMSYEIDNRLRVFERRKLMRIMRSLK